MTHARSFSIMARMTRIGRSCWQRLTSCKAERVHRQMAAAVMKMAEAQTVLGAQVVEVELLLAAAMVSHGAQSGMPWQPTTAMEVVLLLLLLLLLALVQVEVLAQVQL